MPKIAFALLLLLAAPASADEFFAPDKVAHFGFGTACGFLAGTATYHLAKEMGPLERTLTSTAIGILPGIGVEIADKITGYGFSWKDVAADGIGALTGAITAELFNGQFFVAASNKQIKLVAVW